ncbi:LysM domain-containing protein [Homoserinimonas aerilata]|uniref:LysM domain-containing protein n=1 Tax=Homoserinimonas aerilata TaxID=1162970 RepID=A0A542YJS7_9MICO|nr:LysM peptidoglycan-binding domain-containing protein [Homoserinimonas aerilata]TQL48356.1 LysM domain-containing protein [Homoserinimonas aerilata]
MSTSAVDMDFTGVAPASFEASETAAPRAAASHLRITQRGRRVLMTLAALPLVVIALFVALNGGMATATDASGPAELSYVTVSGGDSLWGIAEEIAPGEDPREVIAQLLRFNTLKGSDVVPGQQLAVPTMYVNG